MSRKKGEIIPCPECQHTLFMLVKEKRILGVPGKAPGEETIVNIICAKCNHQDRKSVV
jgi:C4-type Zn-finger protein